MVSVIACSFRGRAIELVGLACLHCYLSTCRCMDHARSIAMAITVAVTRLNLPYGRVHESDPGRTTRRSGREDLLLLRVELRLSQRAGVEEFLEVHQVPVPVRRRGGRLGDGRSGLLGYCGFLPRRSYRLLLGCRLLRLGRTPLGGHVCRGPSTAARLNILGMVPPRV